MTVPVFGAGARPPNNGDKMRVMPFNLGVLTRVSQFCSANELLLRVTGY